MTVWLFGFAALAGAATWAGIGPVLRALPEPEAPEAQKVPYAALPTMRFRVATACCVTAALTISALGVGWPLWLVWTALGTAGVALAAVDARTTYLPGRLMQLGWAMAAAGLLAVGVLHDWSVVGAAVVGAALLGVLFWVLWRITGGLGFGDVRLAVLVGATSGTLGLQWLLTAALVGSLVGVVWGVVATRGYKRSQPFAYGPSLVIGPFLTLLPQSAIAVSGFV